MPYLAKCKSLNQSSFQINTAMEGSNRNFEYLFSITLHIDTSSFES